ncbi:MAG: hypothetical protein IT365_21630 [Candidatus Hydrogenedentes bacterium]|nr:hypothetical protein [Candidatus Hydrogenedentota bacterium]
MHVVVHSPLLDETRERILNAVTMAGPALTVETLPEVQDLPTRLLNTEAEVGLLVIRIVDRHHVKQLFQFREQVRQVRVVMLIPAMDHDTIALAHSFHPRLILCGASSLHELTAVLRKLIGARDGRSATGSTARSAGISSRDTRQTRAVMDTPARALAAPSGDEITPGTTPDIGE